MDRSYTNLKLYCVHTNEQSPWHNHERHPELPFLERAYNVVEHFHCTPTKAYQNTDGHWLRSSKDSKRPYYGTIEFDLSAPLISPAHLLNHRLWVHSISQCTTLWMQGNTTECTLACHPVDKSFYVHTDFNAEQKLIRYQYNDTTRILSIQDKVTQKFCITYRPCLLMMVVSVDQKIKEDDGSSRWKITLTE